MADELGTRLEGVDSIKATTEIKDERGLFRERWVRNAGVL